MVGTGFMVPRFAIGAEIYRMPTSEFDKRNRSVPPAPRARIAGVSVRLNKKL